MNEKPIKVTSNIWLMEEEEYHCEICDQEMESAEYYFCDICPDCRDEQNKFSNGEFP